MRDEEISARLDEVRGRLAVALSRARRPPDSCRLVLASKTQPPAALAAAVRAGVREFGENYVQEGVAKRAALQSLIPGSGDTVTWHLIGHLQTNKARTALAAFDLIETIDSERLAAALFRARSQPLVPALVEINLGGEPSKSGIVPELSEKLLEAARTKVEILGLMTIPPPSAAATTRVYFAKLRELRDRLAAATGLKLSELSMGMSEDYEIAIEEGATIVRVGRAVFGERTS
jgi:pyridoxal phosphate enzyme (YggS family)